MRRLVLVLMLTVCYLAVILIFLVVTALYLEVTACYLVVTGGYCLLPLITARSHFKYEHQSIQTKIKKCLILQFI